MGMDELLADELSRPGSRLGHTVVVKERTGSTNDDARRLADSGASHGAVVIAEEQEKGRGRLGRTWHSPAGKNLLFSIILREGVSAGGTGMITLAAGVAAAEAIRAICRVPAMIKWPNDVRIRGRKVTGVLAEAGPGMEYVILGTGMNVNLAAGDLPADLLDSATSLYMETGEQVQRAGLFKALMINLESMMELVADGNSQKVIERWKELSEAMGKTVRAETPAGIFTGVAESVREDGALVMRADGLERAVVAGDVTIIG